MSKYDDCHRVDNRYTTAIGMSVWRFFNIGKYRFLLNSLAEMKIDLIIISPKNK